MFMRLFIEIYRNILFFGEFGKIQKIYWLILEGDVDGIIVHGTPTWDDSFSHIDWKLITSTFCTHNLNMSLYSEGIE